MRGLGSGQLLQRLVVAVDRLLAGEIDVLLLYEESRNDNVGRCDGWSSMTSTWW